MNEDTIETGAATDAPEPAQAPAPKRRKRRERPGEAPAEDRSMTAAEVAKELVNLMGGLTVEQRELLHRLGYVIPTGDVSGAVEGHYELGYRCRHCGDVSIYFVGNSWPDGPTITLKDGSVRNVPPLTVPIDRIAWTQNRPAHEIDRNSPKCQGNHGNCNSPVHLSGRRTLIGHFIVAIDAFERSKDKAFDRNLIQKMIRDQESAAQGGGGQVGAQSFDHRSENVSDFLRPKDWPEGEPVTKEANQFAKAVVTAISERFDPLAAVRKSK